MAGVRIEIGVRTYELDALNRAETHVVSLARRIADRTAFPRPIASPSDLHALIDLVAAGPRVFPLMRNWSPSWGLPTTPDSRNR